MTVVISALLGGVARGQQPSPAPADLFDPTAVAWPRFVIDVRGATSGVPSDAGFYPATLPEGVLIPARGFGGEIGASVYAGRLGPARLGIGASGMLVRATQDGGTSLTLRVLAPQVSANFGTGNGWSYISGGAGIGGVSAAFDPGGDVERATRRSGRLIVINVGGGARWFFTRRMGFTFDLRLHRLGADGDAAPLPTTSTIVGAAAIGLSFR